MRRAALLILAVLLSAPGRDWAQGEGATITFGAAAYRAGHLDAATPTATRAFAVDDSSALQFVIVSTIPLDVAVVVPDGTVVTAENASALGVSWAAVTVDGINEPPLPGFGAGANVVVGFTTPPPGAYELRLTADALAEPVPFLITMLLDSPVRLGAGVPDAEVLTGQGVVLAALLFEGDAPVHNAILTAGVGLEPQSGEGTPATVAVALLDDGQAADDAAGDGIYSGVFTPTVAGRYGFAVRAEGTASSGAAFLRHAGAGFRVSERSAVLEPPFEAVGVDDDGNGRYERLRISAGVRSDAGGRFVLGTGLRASNGRRVAASAATVIGLGGQRLAVELTAAEVLSLGVDGPYAFAEIRVDELTATDRWLRDRVVDAGQTDALRLAQFEGASLTACVGDCNGDGAVTIDELVRGVNIALGAAVLSVCAACDGNGDGAVSIDELIRAVNMALAGCPPPASPTRSQTATASVSPSASATATLVVPSPSTTASATATSTPSAPPTAPTSPTTTATTAVPSPSRTASATAPSTATRTTAPTPTPSPAVTPTGTPTPTTPLPTTPTASPTAAPEEYCSDLDDAPIPDADPIGIGVALDIHRGGAVERLRVRVLVAHSFVGDLVVTLTRIDDLSAVTLLDRPGHPATVLGCAHGHLACQFDDLAALAAEDMCRTAPPAAVFGLVRPNEPLARFAGGDLAGLWVLSVADLVPGESGSLLQWCLEPY